MFRVNKGLGLILIIFILLVVIPSSFAYENETIMTIDADDSPLEIAAGADVLSENADYYFDASLENDTGNGSAENPYKYLTASRIKDNSNIYLASGEYSLDASKTINQVTFTGNGSNTVLKYNGVIFTVSSSMTLANLTIDGASIYNNGRMNATNTVFSNAYGRNPDSYGNNYGGAIYARSTSAATFIDNCTFINNHAEYGGAIYALGGSLDVINTMFINNFAYNFGGSIACEKGTKLSISKSKFINSSSLGDAGGAIYIKGSSLTVDDAEISDSHATFGGAIASVSSTVDLTHLNVHDSSAKWEGGAVYHIYGKFSSVNGTFTENRARNGGALFIDNSTAFTLKSNSFTANNASYSAGAVYSICNTLNPEDSIRNDNVFSGNLAVFENDEYELSSVDLNIANGNYTMYRYNGTNATVLPAYFSLRDNGGVTVPKDQQSSGSCWAFAALFALESSIIKASGDYLDLSEENMKNVIAKYSDYGWDIETNEGGYFNMPIGYLASWLGPVLESDDAYDDNGVLSPILDSIMHVQNVMFLKRDNFTDNDAIKRAIMEYGAVAVSMAYYGSYFNYATNSYCCYGSDTSNHMVSIVGWDDNYSKTNFRNYGKIDGDGAWIVANSWGSSWANKGYFYVSYYDKKFAQPGVDSSAFAIILNDTIKYERNYQYDIAGMTDYYINASSEFWYKNVFNASGDEYIAAVSTYFEKITDWTASVYVNGVLKAVREGTSNPGYYTIDLGQFIPVKAGDVFEVEFRVNNSGEASIPISEKISLNKLTYGPGISFISFDGVNWRDFYYVNGSYSTHTYYSQVACVKAFTILNVINTTLDMTVGDDYEITVNVADQYGNLLNSNVYLDINGFVYDLKLNNGIAVLSNPLLNQTHNIITAIFNRTGYNSSMKTASVDISRKNTTLALNISHVSNRATIILESPDNINTSMMVRINGSNHLAIFENGNAYINLEGLENGFYTVEVICENLSAYLFDDLSGNFTINVKSTRIVSGDLLTTDDGNDSFNITLLDEYGCLLAGKELVILLNNLTIIENTDSNGRVSIPINLDMGQYFVEILFNGDGDYAPSNQSNTIKVKMDVAIDFTLKRSLNDIAVNVSLSRSINESLTVVVNNRTYVISSVNGSAFLELLNLSNGEYNISVGLNDDLDFYNTQAVNSTFNVDVKHVIISSSDIIINDVDDFAFNITLTDESGARLANKNVTFVLNGITYNEATDGDGVASIYLDLASGVYEILVSFEDNDYFPSSVSNTIKVKAKVDISIGAYVYQDEARVIIEVSRPINDSSIVFFNGNPNLINLINGSAVIILTDMANGNYTFEVILNDEFYDFTPVGLTFPIDVKRTKIISSDMVTSDVASDSFNVTLVDENDVALPGKEISIVLGNVTYTRITDSNGRASIPVNLTHGDYLAEISFKGDVNYFESTKTNAIKVKMNVGIGMSFKRSLNDVVVNVSLSRLINESLTLIVNDNSYSLSAVNGNAVLELKNLSNGVYNVSMGLDDVDSYDFSVVNSSFTVDVKGTKIKSGNLTITDEDKVSFNATLTDENGVTLAGRKVAFDLNGIVSNAITDNGGVAFIPVALPSGEYALSIRFGGDNDYFASDANNVIKVKTMLNIAVSIDTYQNTAAICINMSKPVNETVNVIVNGRSYAVTAVNGNALLCLDGLLNDDYDVTVTLDENDYEFSQSGADFSIDVRNTEILSADLVIDDEDHSNFNVTLVDENGALLADKEIGFVLNGVSYKGFTDNRGVAFIAIDLASGKYEMAIGFAGDEDYFASSTSNLITVKTRVNIDVSVDVYQNRAVIDINMSKPVNETLNVNVNDNSYSVSSINGKASLELHDLSKGAYQVNVYMDDDYHVVSDGSAFGIDVNITRIKSEDLTVCDDDDVKFTATLTDGNGIALADKKVTFVLNGNTYHVITDKDGVASVPLDLESGVYDIAVGFDGDADYFASNASNVITVKTRVNIDVSVDVYQDNAVIGINVSKALNETVNVIVNGRSFAVDSKRGKALFELSGLPNGVYEVIVGLDENRYESSPAGFNFTIDVKGTQISSDDLTITDEDNVKFNITLTGENGVALADKEITFVLNGVSYAKITDGNGVASIPLDLASGAYDVSVAFDGDEDYFASSAVNAITVKTKVDITISVDVYQKDAMIDISMSKPVNETVNVNVNGERYVLHSINGKASFNLFNLSKGGYEVNAALDNGNYASLPASYLFGINVNKTKFVSGDLAISDEDNADFYATLTNDNGIALPNRNVTFVLNGITYNRITDDAGIASIPIDLASGKYEIAIAFAGDEDNLPSTAENAINVKTKVDIGVSADIYQNDAVININISKSASDLVTVNVNDKSYAVNSSKGKALLELSGLANGVYDVDVSLNGDDYEFVLARYSFVIDVKASQIRSSDLIITDEDNVNFNVTLVDENGIALANRNVRFVLNGVTYNMGTDGDGVASIPLDLDSGKYEIAISFAGDENHFASSAVNVIKVKTKVNIAVSVDVYQDNAVIDINVSKSVSDLVTVNVNDKSYAVNSSKGKALLELFGLANGVYDVDVSLNGDDYEFVLARYSFVIDVKASEIKSSDLTITDEDNVNFNVTLEDENGIALAGRQITFVLNGVTYDRVTDGDGFASIPLDLDSGKYEIAISFAGDENHFASSAVNVIKVKTKVDIAVSVDVYQDNAAIDIYVSKSVSDLVTVNVNDNAYAVNSSKGKALLELSGLANGVYDVDVSLNGDDYEFVPASYSFVIDVKASEIRSSDLIITDEDNVDFNVTLMDENGIALVGREITFVLNGITYNRITDDDGFASIPLDLASGKYEIAIGFAGNADYFPSNAVNAINVKTKVDIGVSTSVYRNSAVVNINVSKSVSDLVTVNVNDKIYVVNSTNGKALLELSGLFYGAYDVNVSLNADDYEFTSASSSFKIEVKSTEIRSSDLTITDEDNANFNVTLADEKGVLLADKPLTFVLNGVTYNRVTDDYGAASIPLDLAIGKYEIAIAFAGDEEYVESSAVNAINVKTKVDIGVSASIYQNNAVININISKSVSDLVTVNVNDKAYAINSTNGRALLELSDLDNGVYVVNVNLNGDDYEFAPTSYSFVIDVKATQIKTGDLTITDEDDAIFNVTLADENGIALANRNVSFALNGITYNRVTDGDGVAFIPLDLESGKYEITISFAGDEDHFASSAANVIKVKTKVDIGVSASVYRNSAVVSINVSKSVNGTINVIVNGRSYAVDSIDGKALLELSGLDNGVYVVNVKLNDDYEFPQLSHYFVIDVKASKIRASDLTITDEDNADFKVTLTDEYGTTLTSRNVSFALNGVTYNRVTDEKGVASIPLDLATGKHEIAIAFAGDDKYLASSAVNVITVKTKVDIGVSAGIYQNNAVIDINVSKSVSELMTVNVNDKVYAVNSSQGRASLELSGLANGIYLVNVNLNEDYDFAPASYSFEIDVKATQIRSADLTISDDDKVNFNATLTDENGVALADKQIVFVLNGITYNGITDNRGVASIPLDLAGGKYEITVAFGGDESHFASGASNAIVVKTNVAISVSVGVLQSDAVIDITLSKAISESLNVNVNGKAYVVPAISGKASLELFNLSDGTYDVTVRLDNDNYNSLAVKSTFTITKVVPHVVVLDDDNDMFNITVADENDSILANKEVSIVVGNATYTMVTDASGQVSLPADLGLGQHSIEIYERNDGDFKLVKSDSIVIKSKLRIDYSIHDSDKTSINVNLSKMINGTLEIIVDGESHILPVSNETMSLTLDNLNATVHDVEIRIMEDDCYEFNKVSSKFDVDAKKTNLIANDMQTYFQSGKEFAATLTDEYGNPLSGKVIQFRIAGNTYSARTDDMGQARISISLGNGNYDISASFTGDERYCNSSSTAKISVKSTIVLSDSLTKTYNSEYSFKLLDINGNPLKNANVVFSIDNVDYAGITDKNGIVHVKITKESGNLELTIRNPVNNETSLKTIAVAKRISQNRDVTVYELSASPYKVLILDDNGNHESAGKIVTFNAAGKTYTVKTDKDGYATLKISLTHRSGTITVSYKGFSVSNKLTVKPLIVAKNVVKKKAKSYKFQAKLINKNGKAVKGKKLTFKIKGKKYTAKTNKKGIAKITIKLPLKVGTYKIYTSCGKSKVTNTLRIKK